MLDGLVVLTWRIPRVRAEDLEKLAVPEAHEQPLREALAANGVKDAFYVATCQRIVLAADGETRAVESAFARALADVHPGARLPEGGEAFRGFEAFAHLCEVSSSLDSLVPGEAQVLGQFKAAWARADAAGVAAAKRGADAPGGVLSDASVGRAMPLVFRTAKRIRSQSDLFRGKVSLVPLTVDVLAEHLKGEKRSIAVVGTGQIGQRMLDFAAQHKPTEVHVVSRERPRAVEVADRRGAVAHGLQEFLEAPPRVDVVVLATRAGTAYFTPQHAERLVALRNGGPPLLVLDLSMPRNADERVGKVDRVRLVQMDDLAAIAEKGRNGRRNAVGHARALLGAELARVRRELEARSDTSDVVRLRAEIEAAALARLEVGRRLPVQDRARFEKWYWQTVRHLTHVAQEQARKRK